MLGKASSPLFLALVLATLAACSAASSSDAVCTSDDQCESGTCDGGVCVTADVVPIDTDRPDVVEDTTPSDTGNDGSDVPDGSGDTDGPCVGFQCPCEEHSDCSRGYCIDTGDGRVCTVPCVDRCPDPEWECRFVVGSGGDALQICVPPDDTLCNPCDGDVDCGSLDDRCIEQADGMFCARDCAETRTCPEGYVCDSVAVGAGGGDTAWQCVPSVGVCGACIDLDNDGYGVGPECLGEDCDDLEPARFEGNAEVCDGLDNDCDDEVDEDFDTDTDLRHCGGCNQACDPDNADTFECVEGACTILECTPGWDDCNEEVDDGCEINITEDLDNCGLCDRVCDLADTDEHICDGGICRVSSCDGGYDDCNEEDWDGCEIDLTSDPLNCDECGFECSLADASSTCLGRTCVVSGCVGTLRDCNEEDWDGCEVDIDSRLDHCGLCGFACDTTHVTVQRCDAGECVIDDCEDDWDDCNGEPSDGCERYLLDNVAHCGECDNLCNEPHAVNVCDSGSCLVTDCATGWSDLDGDLQNGCDYECTFISADDIPDDGFLDANCDGVDGTISDAIFVSTLGNDSRSGTTPGESVRSISTGLSKAAATGRHTVLVHSAAYTGGTLSVPNGVSVYGGYAADFRSRTNSRARYTATSNIALRVTSASATVAIDRLDLSTPNQGDNGWTAVVVVSNSGDNVRISHSDLSAGNGGAGAGGGRGGDGSGGGRGGNAYGSTGGSGGSGGGGGGGNGRRQDTGLPGASGASNSSTGGAGGGGGYDTQCDDGDPHRGGDGGNGSPGSRGSNGSHSPGGLALSPGGTWSAGVGGAGTSGGRGGGGGGGGAGGGEDCTIFGGCVYCGTGRGGGGGGGGGAGGDGGGSGRDGGASIGLVIDRSTVRISNSTVTAARGGNGGSGGAGGTGGNGGAGGAGAFDSDNTTGEGGDGGAGGAGGSGGCGGAGRGGPSVGIWGYGAATVYLGTGASISAAPAATAGSSCAGSAPSGISATTRSVTVL